MSGLPPLLQLMVGNLDDAVRLGLIDDSTGAAAGFRHRAIGAWPAVSKGVDQPGHHADEMHLATGDLDLSHRPIRYRHLKTRRVTTVMTFRRFVGSPAGSLAPTLASVISAGSAAELQNVATGSAAVADHWHAAHEEILRFNGLWGHSDFGGRAGTRIRAGSIVSSGLRMWVSASGRTASNTTAQFWRDRLGLIHLTSPAVPTLADACLRVDFEIEPKKSPINRVDWKATLKQYRNDRDAVWLLRPTLVHGGNSRFVQSHPGDDRTKGGGPVSAGRTRDLAARRHEPGNNELLLVCGPAAEMMFCGAQLLEGIPTHLRDRTDAEFVNDMRSERRWR